MASAILFAEIEGAPFTEEQRRCLETHLGQLLASSPFATSRRSQAFLRYVVEETLAGRGHAIKERNIAVDVFSKPSTFDTQNESIVRVNANELRKRLASAYEGELSASDVRIELPIGTYQPVFHKPCSAVPKAGPAAATVGRKPVRPYLAIGTLACLAITAGWVTYSRESRLALDLLWDSFVSRGSVVLIALPAPTVLELSHQDKWLPFEPGMSVPISELRAKETYYVGTGAALGAARFGEQLGRRRQPFLVKFGSEVTFPDLGQSPAILLGGYSSAWSIELTQTLRFRMEREAGSNTIVDTFEPRRVWRAASSTGSVEAREGYALVTRLMNSESGHPLLIAAGMSARDTEAAAKFLSDPAYFDLFAKSAGRWSRKNFQVVLHDYVHGHSPGAPIVLAWYVW